MLPISTRNATLASLMIALGLTMSACSKHESAESKPTEEIAAEQGEIARANHPMPVASQPASFVPPTAASAAATTTGRQTVGSVPAVARSAALAGSLGAAMPALATRSVAGSVVKNPPGRCDRPPRPGWCRSDSGRRGTNRVRHRGACGSRRVGASP